ncbi:hypothetical protein ACFXG4_50200 [Nocardia sp. NPDC059246]|uniref:hypothetical protein n=1 Tax=unclassified Nocardia TaxID=2637762 RepID=UPI0036CD4933
MAVLTVVEKVKVSTTTASPRSAASLAAAWLARDAVNFQACCQCRYLKLLTEVWQSDRLR